MSGTAIARATLLGSPMALHVLPRPGHLVQDAPPMVDQQPARLRGRDAAAIAHQQVLAQLHLQQAHLPAQGRLGHAEGRRGMGEAAHFGDPHKVLELLQIHRQMRYLVDQSATSCIAGIAAEYPKILSHQTIL